MTFEGILSGNVPTYRSYCRLHYTHTHKTNHLYVVPRIVSITLQSCELIYSSLFFFSFSIIRRVLLCGLPFMLIFYLFFEAIGDFLVCLVTCMGETRNKYIILQMEIAEKRNPALLLRCVKFRYAAVPSQTLSLRGW